MIHSLFRYGSLILSLSGVFSTALVAQESDSQPNVIFILADDLGWGDLGCYGHPHIKTPELDKLAGNGTLLTQFYVNGSVCSPSRTAFFTATYPARLRIHDFISTPEENEARGMADYVDPAVPNLATTFKDAGYTTAHIGKWHMAKKGPAIRRYGFDYVGPAEEPGKGPRDDPYFMAKSTERFVDYALDFIDRNDGKYPFFIQLWTLTPHATLNPTPEQMERYKGFRPSKTIPGFNHRSAAEIYYSTVTDLDTQIGRLLKGLEERDLDRNTIIVFSSDNGPEDIHIIGAGHSGIGSAGPFRGRKRSLYEGGVRMPFIVSWPGHIPADRIDNESVVSGIDLLPTLCGLTGVPLPDDFQGDGEDASAALLGEGWERTDPLYWEWRFGFFGEPFHHSPELAIREGDWKLLLNPDESRLELYNIPEDPTELTNLATEHPDLVEKMEKEALAWQATLPDGPVSPRAGKQYYSYPEGFQDED